MVKNHWYFDSNLNRLNIKLDQMFLKTTNFFSSSRLWIWFLELFHFDCIFSLVNLSIHWCFVFLLLVLNNFQFLATFRSFHRISAQYLFNVSSSTHSFSSHYEFWTSFPLLLILSSNCQQFFFLLLFSFDDIFVCAELALSIW